MLRTQEEVDRMIERLKAAKAGVPALTSFGDDNHATIEAQIEVLEQKLAHNTVEQRFADDQPDLYYTVLATVGWLYGEEETDEIAGAWEELAGITTTTHTTEELVAMLPQKLIDEAGDKE
jgi:hypothetical protein